MRRIEFSSACGKEHVFREIEIWVLTVSVKELCFDREILKMTFINILPDREEVLRHVEKVDRSYHIKGPRLPTHFPWFNVQHPLSENDLRGKIVLLDFWTYCCINCMHVIPELKRLEEKYRDRPFVVIGVHSGKFTNERDEHNVRQAILRHEISHPVIVDQNFSLWQGYSVHAWPTLVLLDPEGNIEATFSGESQGEIIDMYVEVMLEKYEKEGRLINRPLPLRQEKDQFSASALNFPGKVLVDPVRRWLFISDTGNNRIVVTDMDGRVRQIIGSGGRGLSDGPFAQARFLHPQGLALYRGQLLVADTENHVIRMVDFESREVQTLAGTGRQGHYFEGTSHARNVSISSPWDLAVIGDRCFIAMAGLHQIWVLDLIAQTIQIYAGSGVEGRIDGHRKKAAFAQPSGLATDQKFLYVADSEVSCVRSLDLNLDGRVGTVVGGDLFEFGDVDGYGDDVRLQHPLGLELVKGKLYLADTYNHKIKIIDPELRESVSYLGDGKPGCGEGANSQFNEPGGLSSYEETLYVADTNNNRIAVIDLTSGRTSTLEIKDLPRPAAGQEQVGLTSKLSITQTIDHTPICVSPAGFLIRIEIRLLPHQKISTGSRFQYILRGDSNIFQAPDLNQIRTLPRTGRSIEIPVETKVSLGRHNLYIELVYFFCDDEKGICKMRAAQHCVPIEICDSGVCVVYIHDNPR